MQGRSPRRLAALAALAAIVAAAPAGAAAPALSRQRVEVGDFVGLSDLAFDAGGQVWSVPERQPFLLALQLGGPGAATLARPALPIVGLSAGQEVESLAWIDDQTVALGTETDAWWRRSDLVLIARLGPGGAVVQERIPLPWGLWKMRARSNQGIEGMCFAGGQLLAAGETVGRLPDGRRAAPLGRLDWHSRVWTPLWLPLSSRQGKISALTCRLNEAEGQLEVLAIERHFGTSQLLRFVVPQHGGSTVLTAEVWRDLAAEVADLPNLEGIARAPDGTIWLISDNHYRRVTGPTEAFALPPPP